MKNESFEADLRSLQRAIAFGAPSGRMSMTPPAEIPSGDQPENSRTESQARKIVQPEIQRSKTPARVA